MEGGSRFGEGGVHGLVGRGKRKRKTERRREKGVSVCGLRKRFGIWQRRRGRRKKIGGRGHSVLGLREEGYGLVGLRKQRGEERRGEEREGMVAHGLEGGGLGWASYGGGVVMEVWS
ncbi:uncharacterized protein G2W53_027263 [Senna tora]|uniref:Uncharacterized protein n=1 Tax=Senna tora TaxID=362788 RepID=A0A834WI93_9FABA|nr:uncharacterized protein G2W53_027263 [Senna tora]